jgi:hypothetical protein
MHGRTARRTILDLKKEGAVMKQVVIVFISFVAEKAQAARFTVARSGFAGRAVLGSTVNVAAAFYRSWRFF